MFREMRRNKQLLSPEETACLLEAGTSGILAVSGDDGYPYAVPLSYAYDRHENKLYFHCAKSGHKLDAIKLNGKASFCVIGQDTVVPEKYTTYFKSVIAFGQIHIIENPDMQYAAAAKLSLKYNPDAGEDELHKEISEAAPRLCMLEMQVLHLTGKQAIELVKKPQDA